MNINSIVNKLIKLSGRDSVIINDSIPYLYLLRLLVEKLIERFWGVCRTRTLKPIFISPSAIIKASGLIKFKGFLSVAPNCYIDALGSEGIILGKGVSIGRGTMIVVSGSLQNLGKGIRIGNNVGFSTSCYIGGAGGVEIGDDTIFGNYVSIHPENHVYNDPNIPIRLQGVSHKGIIIGKGCWIGAKATILDGTRIGNGCIVAAGAVVRGEFPDNVIIGGVPAKIIKLRF